VPIYEFECNDCGNIISELRRIGDSSNAECPECNSMHTRRIMSIFAGGRSCADCSSASTCSGG